MKTRTTKDIKARPAHSRSGISPDVSVSGKSDGVVSRILRMESVDWRSLSWLQGGLKEMTTEDFDKLRRSIIANDFVTPFHVWEDGNGEQWILDGHHRKKVLEAIAADGIVVPDKLPAIFVQCKDRKEAAKLVIVYSSTFATITNEGLYAFMHDNAFSFDELLSDLRLADFDIEKFEAGYMKDGPPEDDGKGRDNRVIVEMKIDRQTFKDVEDQVRELAAMDGIEADIQQ